MIYEIVASAPKFRFLSLMSEADILYIWYTLEYAK